jgi:hypothetical protein
VPAVMRMQTHQAGCELARGTDTSNKCRDVRELGFPVLPHASPGHARPHYGVNSSRAMLAVSFQCYRARTWSCLVDTTLHRVSRPCLQLAASQKIFLVASSPTTFVFSPGLPTLPVTCVSGCGTILVSIYTLLVAPVFRTSPPVGHPTTRLGQMTSRKSTCTALPVDLKTET